MCIACELGYWAMIDALEAERAASRRIAAVSDESGFVCEMPEQSKASDAGVRQSPDEPKP